VELFSWKEKRPEKWTLDEAGKQAEASALKAKGTEAFKQVCAPRLVSLSTIPVESTEGVSQNLSPG